GRPRVVGRRRPARRDVDRRQHVQPRGLGLAGYGAVAMEVTTTQIKDLRERTGAGMSDCKKALTETSGDMDKAIDYLRAKGLAKAAKKAGREATEGLVVSYIHGGGRIGVLLEVNCGTDSAARA